MLKFFYQMVLGLCLLLGLTQCQNAPKAEEKITDPVVEKGKMAQETLKAAKMQTDSLAMVKAEETMVDSLGNKNTTTAKEVIAKSSTSVAKKEAPAPVKKKKKKRRAKIKFNELVHKFGTIKTGDKVSHQFKFKNTGNAPLVIKSVDVSCGCTFPSYPFLPIEPGKEGAIDVTFDSEHKVGRQKPTITVVTNGRPRTIKLNLEGFVE